jgi:hypothetical protein
MGNPVEIQDIEEMRRNEGIDDVKLRLDIRGLKAGDFVKLSLLTGTATFETLLVRITSVRGSAFRGKLASRPNSTSLLKLQRGPSIAFTTAHIHSIAKMAATHDE